MELLVRHDDRATRAQAASYTPAEVPGYTSLLRTGRRRVRDLIGADAAAIDDDGVQVSEFSVRVEKTTVDPAHRDFIAEFTAAGSGLVRLASRTPDRRTSVVLPVH
jgi:hypothetical protein